MFSLKRRRRQMLMSKAFPPEWLSILERSVSLYSRLPPADQQELRGRVLVFLNEKRFEGCGGLTLSDEIRLTIAAHACVLLLHREEADYYPLLKSILVYPSHFSMPQTRPVWVEGLVPCCYGSMEDSRRDVKVDWPADDWS